MNWILSILTSFFSGRIKDYKDKVEKLRTILDKFEKGTDPKITIESDEELLLRAQSYLERFKGRDLFGLNGNLLPVIERLVNDIDLLRGRFWFRLLKRFKF